MKQFRRHQHIISASLTHTIRVSSDNYTALRSASESISVEPGPFPNTCTMPALLCMHALCLSCLEQVQSS